MLLADLVYDVPANVILDSARRALSGYDVITSCIKAWVFGLIISTVSEGAGCSRLEVASTVLPALFALWGPGLTLHTWLGVRAHHQHGAAAIGCMPAAGCSNVCWA